MQRGSNGFEKVDLFITAKGLPKVQTFSNTDPFAVVLLRDNADSPFAVVGITEVVWDNQNPNWTTSFTVDFLFEVIQEVVVRVYHCGGKNLPLTDASKHTFLGETKVEMTALTRSGGSKVEAALTGGKATGSVGIKAEPRVNTRDLFCVTFGGHKLANKDGFFGTSDPFLQVSRLNEDNSWTVVWKSVKIDNTLNPRWAEAKIPVATLCNADYDRPLRIEIFDFEKSGKHQSMGMVDTSVNFMINNPGAPMNVIEPDQKAKKKNYVNSGTLTAGGGRIEHHPTFVDYLRGGCELSLMVAIDFTGSNGDPSLPDSLHYVVNGGRLNPYEHCITVIGSVLEQYDKDKKFPVYGFGARVRDPTSGEWTAVQHCFPIFGGGMEVVGAEGILNAYRACVKAVMFSGPTLFAPLIGAGHYLANAAACSQVTQKYTILLIITDGVINDLDATISGLIDASEQPLSVVIIGVGNADFSEMRSLDSDAKLLSNGVKTAKRDIVQFVHFNDCIAKGPGVLAKEVLGEIPTQFLKCMEARGIVPNRVA